MEIDYRLSDINKLQNEVLQCLAKFMLHDGWKKQMISKRNDFQKLLAYKEFYNRIDDRDIDDWDIEDLDVTVINAVFHNKSISKTNGDIRILVEKIAKDRNIISHRTYNESISDLYVLVIICTYHLKELITETYDFLERTCEYDTLKMLKEKKDRLDDMQKKVMEEAAIVIGKEAEVNRTLDWCVAREEVKEQRFKSKCNIYFERSQEDYDSYVMFLKKTIERGFSDAHILYAASLLQTNYIPRLETQEKCDEIAKHLLLSYSYCDKARFLSVSFFFFTLLYKEGFNIQMYPSLTSKIGECGYRIVVINKKLYFENYATNSLYENQSVRVICSKKFINVI